jgi:hypothetical protein
VRRILCTTISLPSDQGKDGRAKSQKAKDDICPRKGDERGKTIDQEKQYRAPGSK